MEYTNSDEHGIYIIYFTSILHIQITKHNFIIEISSFNASALPRGNAGAGSDVTCGSVALLTETTPAAPHYENIAI